MAADKKATNYKKQVEETLVHYINSGHFTLSQAHEYMTKLVDTIFGNDEHSGLYEFIKSDYKDLNLEDEEVLKRCEKMFENGWRVMPHEGKFWLVDDNLRAVKDVTGPQTIMEPEEEKEALLITQETAYIFLKHESRAKLVKAAKPLNIDPVEFKSPQFTYNFVFDKTGGADSDLFPLAQSYRGLSKILTRLAYFPYVKEMTDITQLYESGFRLSDDKINPTTFSRAYIESKTKNYILTPVRNDMIGNRYQDELAILYAYKKREALKDLGIDVEVPLQVGEKGQTFALMFEDKEDYTDLQDLGEIIRILDSVESNHRNKSYPSASYKKLIQNICALAVIEAILFGNGRFSLADITINTVQSSIKLRYTGKVTTHTPQELMTFLNSFKSASKNKPVMEALLGRLSLRDPKFRENFGVLLQNLPENFEEIINGIDTSDLPKGYEQVKSTLIKVLGVA